MTKKELEQLLEQQSRALYELIRDADRAFDAREKQTHRRLRREIRDLQKQHDQTSRSLERYAQLHV